MTLQIITEGCSAILLNEVDVPTLAAELRAHRTSPLEAHALLNVVEAFEDDEEEDTDKCRTCGADIAKGDGICDRCDAKERRTHN